MSQIVERLEDMSPCGFLRLILQTDGDVIVVVSPDPSDTDQKFFAGTARQVEICTHAGGGKSPRTLKALHALFDAMVQDNQDSKCDGRKGKFDGSCNGQG